MTTNECRNARVGLTRRAVTVGLGAIAAGTHSNAFAALVPEAEKELYAAAQKEGEVTLYTAHYAADLAERFGAAFTAKYPGVKVNVVRTTAQVAYQRLTQELKSGGPQVDLFQSTDIGHCVELKAKGLLEKYVPANAKSLIPSLQNVDPDGFYHTTAIGIVGITYNTSKVKPGEAPKAWKDLLDPRWKNQVSVGHPAFSGYVGIWTYEMNRLYGWDYFEKLKANAPQIGRSIQDTLTMLRAGERSVAAGATQTALEAKLRGEPIDIVYPEDGTIIVISPSAIPKGCKHPNAAKLLLEFFSSPEASVVSLTGQQDGIHPGSTPKGATPFQNLKTLVANADALVKGIPDIKEKWRDTFGI
jgi:iron(III) transport system substrate-binding protein